MIPIKIVNGHKKSLRHATIINSYLTTYKGGSPLKAINSWLKKVFGNSIDYNSVVIANPALMEKLAHKFQTSGIALDSSLDELKKIYTRFRTNTKTPLESSSGVKYDGFAFSSLIDVSVCPYCNRNYIINLNESGIATCELDHFYNKDKFPFFALSFYNLIPACRPCNHIKSNKTGKYHNPHSKKYTHDDLIKFSVEITGANYLDILSDLELKYDYHKDFEDTFIHLKINEVYEFHKIYVQDLIKKKHLYSEEYLEQLIVDFGGKIFRSREELLGLLLPGYINDDRLCLRPFSKLSKDIWEQLSEMY